MVLMRDLWPRVIAMAVFPTLKCLESILISAVLASPSWGLARR